MDLKRGDKFGTYEILSSLGAGGMGEVYRARDTKLGRDVALKFLTDGVAVDGDRRTRFDREARTLAALNHPGIVAIYAIETEGERPFIAMECVEGRVLQELIPRAGLPLDRLLAIATQIAGAVAAAHRHGIVHRDLKPANVMVGAHDHVKVLDFGLAKLREAPAATAETLPTQQVITGEGRILGTVAYMSPEQAEGRNVDHRSDIFSLGVLLYEMASGERPFRGDTSLSVLSSILRDTPKPLSEINPKLPRELARIVRRCLAKDPDERYQSAADLRNDLEDVRQSSISGELFQPTIKSKTRRMPLPWTAAVILAMTAIGTIAMIALPRRAAAVLPIPQMSFSRLTLLDSVASEPVISPDGKWVAYVSNVAGNADIYLQSNSGQTAINLTKDSTASDRMPAFSPDGELIAFQSDRDGGGLFVMGRMGESVRRLTKMGFQPAWFPDGRRLVFASLQVSSADTRGGGISELWTVDAGGGEPERIFRGDAVQPRVSPNGKRIAFWSLEASADYTTFDSPNRDVWTIAADGSDPIRVTSEAATDWNPVWSPAGDALFFLSNRSGLMNLCRIGIDEATGATIGAVQALTAPVTYVRHFSLSADGRLGNFANLANVGNLARVKFNVATTSIDGPVEPITNGPRDFMTFDVNPDGSNNVVLMNSFTQQEDLLIADRTGLRHILNDRFRDRNPRWMPDGRRILFYSDRSQNYELYSIERDGGGLRRLTDTGGKRYYPLPSSDGSKVLAADIVGYELFVYDVNDFSKPVEQLPLFPKELRGGSFIPLGWSPDNRSVMGLSGATLWVYSFETRTYKRLVSGAGSFTGQWIDARQILFNRQGRLFTLDVPTGAERQVMATLGETIGSARVSPDGNYLYFIRGNSTGDIWLVRFDDGPSAASPATDAK